MITDTPIDRRMYAHQAFDLANEIMEDEYEPDKPNEYQKQLLKTAQALRNAGHELLMLEHTVKV